MQNGETRGKAGSLEKIAGNVRVGRLVTEGKKVLAQIPEWNGRIWEFEVIGLDYEDVGLFKCLDSIIQNLGSRCRAHSV